ncbi:nuclear transport factor 2 family protein [Cedecea colo]|uniref:Nuclear transport factor 2 family protein n=1 Tax=Cedecea colo TaxID=2552946 RepID=A0ABX0VNZ7_9ENTR|nr:nuclear transport factor 2 family protein [Cedecea colo]
MNETLQQLQAFEQRRQQAMIEADLDVLSQLLADELVHVHSTGLVHNKQQLLEHVRRMGGFVAIERDEPAIQIQGDIAIMTGYTRNTVRSLENGLVMVREGFSTLLLRHDAAGWRILLSQLTPCQR